MEYWWLEKSETNEMQFNYVISSLPVPILGSPRTGFLLFWPWREAKVKRTLTHSESIPVQWLPACPFLSRSHKQLMFRPLIVTASVVCRNLWCGLSVINLFLVYNLLQSEVFNLLKRFLKITLPVCWSVICILHISKQTGPSNLKIFYIPEIQLK